MVEKIFPRLFQKYLDGSINAQELIQLQALVQEPNQQESLENALAAAFNNKELIFKGDYDSHEMYQQFLEKIKEQKITSPIHKIHTSVRPMINDKIWWAAAILIGISFGTYFLIKNQKTTTPAIATAPTNTDVAPGGNKAILTLNNGSKIILDSAHNGVLAQQGNTKIIKTDSGKLAYSISTEKPTEMVPNTLTTPRGGQYQLTLPDGTKVWLNAASSITYPTAFFGGDRKVKITGEVYFEVVHDALKPFKVLVNGLEVEDIGTHFNINAYPDENSISTTLIEGSVKLKQDKKEKLLYPGQEAKLKSDGEITIVRDVDIKKIIAWKNGEFRFDGDDL